MHDWPPKDRHLINRYGVLLNKSEKTPSQPTVHPFINAIPIAIFMVAVIATINVISQNVISLVEIHIGHQLEKITAFCFQLAATDWANSDREWDGNGCILIAT